MATATLLEGLCISNSLQSIPTNSCRRPSTTAQQRQPHLLKPQQSLLRMRHATIIKNGSPSFDPFVTRLLCSYACLGYMADALRLFDNISNPDTFQWNVMIKGYVDKGFFEEAFEFYQLMQFMGIRTDNYTFPFVIKSCAGLCSFVEGWKIHCRLIKVGFDLDVYVGNSLISMYAKTGCIDFAEKVFDEMPMRDSVSWNSMIGGYALDGDGWKALLCFQEMMECGIEADRSLLILTFFFFLLRLLKGKKYTGFKLITSLVFFQKNLKK